MVRSVKRIAASILAADFGRLGDEVKAVEEAGADWIHVDVMDGHFVPNLTIGPPVVAAIKRASRLPLDVHLMITNPERYIGEYAKAGATYISVHQETCPHLHAVVQDIRAHGCKPSVVLNPATPFHTLDSILADIEMVLIMSVNPGFGGQSFIRSALDKLSLARRVKQERGLRLPHRGRRRGEDREPRRVSVGRGRGLRHRHRDLRNAELSRHNPGDAQPHGVIRRALPCRTIGKPRRLC